MNNSSPLIPQGTLLEQQTKGRARFKVAVLCVFGFHVLLFGGVLMLGCKRETTTASQDATQSNSNPTTDTTTMSAATPSTPSNDPAATTPSTAATANPTTAPTTPTLPATTVTTPAATTTPTSVPVFTAGTAQEYTLVKGDTYSSIGKKFGVSIKALVAANPTMPATKLMPGKKIQVPAPTIAAATTTTTSAPGAIADSSDTYVVKSGDSLTAIAHGHSTTVKALMAANSLTTTRIRVGDKLHLPAPKASTPPAVPTDSTSVPTSTTSAPSISAPATTLK